MKYAGLKGEKYILKGGLGNKSFGEMLKKSELEIKHKKSLTTNIYQTQQKI